MTFPPNPPCRWLKISIGADPTLSDAIEDFLIGMGDAGVERIADQTGEATLIHGYFDINQEERDTTERILSQLTDYLRELAAIFAVATPVMTTAFIEDEDWSATWKEHFKPFAIIPGLIIAPTWEEYQAGEGEQVIVMDPGMAFGTGHHATTSLSLEFVREALAGKNDRSVLDVGTGTGILGMAAALFGASRVMAIDNDPEAVSAAKENVARNRLQQIMEVEITPLASLTGTYSLVIANIVHDVLLELAPDLGRLTAAGGRLILSGILAGPQVTSIVARFAGLGFSLVRQEQKQEWATLLFARG